MAPKSVQAVLFAFYFLLFTSLGLCACHPRSAAVSPKAAASAYERAADHFQRSEWKLALTSIDTALAGDPGNPGYLSLKGRALLRLGRARAALDVLQKATARGADDFETHSALAEALDILWQPAKAEVHAAAAVRISPDDAAARYSHGLLLLKLERFEEAADALATAANLLPGEPRILLAVCQAERKLGQLDAAEASANSALEEAASEGNGLGSGDLDLQVQALLALAEISLLRGRAPDTRRAAGAYCEEAFRLGGGGPEAQVLVARTYLDGGAPDRALEWVNLPNGSRSVETMAIEAEALLDLGKEPARALADVQTALGGTPPEEWPHLFLLRGRAEQMLGRRDKAREDFERVLRMPSPPSVAGEARRRLDALERPG